MSHVSRRNLFTIVLLGLMLSVASSTALAQHYTKGTLVKNAGTFKNIDPQLINAWGLAYAPSNPFWISDAGSGFTIVYNGSSEFKIMNWTSLFLFATLDGTISGWSHFNPAAALIGVNNSGSGAVYTGLAITSKPSGNF